MVGPRPPEFLIQWFWWKTWECAFLTSSPLMLVQDYSFRTGLAPSQNLQSNYRKENGISLRNLGSNPDRPLIHCMVRKVHYLSCPIRLPGKRNNVSLLMRSNEGQKKKWVNYKPHLFRPIGSQLSEGGRSSANTYDSPARRDLSLNPHSPPCAHPQSDTAALVSTFHVYYNCLPVSFSSASQKTLSLPMTLSLVPRPVPVTKQAFHIDFLNE